MRDLNSKPLVIGADISLYKRLREAGAAYYNEGRFPSVDATRWDSGAPTMRSLRTRARVASIVLIYSSYNCNARSRLPPRWGRTPLTPGDAARRA